MRSRNSTYVICMYVQLLIDISFYAFNLRRWKSRSLIRPQALFFLSLGTRLVEEMRVALSSAHSVYGTREKFQSKDLPKGCCSLLDP